MKQKGFFFLSLFCLLCVLSCKKATDCTGIIRTVIVDEAGVKTPLGDCELIIGNEDFDPKVKRIVKTDASGYYEGVWLRQGYLPVNASKDGYHGVAYLDLTPGNVTELEIQMY